MRRFVRRRWNVLATVLVVGLVAGVLTAVALDTPGYRAAEVDLDDATVWVSAQNVLVDGQNRAQVGKINAATPAIESAITPESSADLYQSGRATLVSTAAGLARIEAGTDAVSGTPRKLPAAAHVALGPNLAAIVDTSNGSLWTGAPDDLVRQEAGARPTATVDRRSLLVVGADDVVTAYAPGASKAQQVDGAGTVTDVALGGNAGTAKTTVDDTDTATAEGAVQLSVAGEHPVVLDVARRRVLVAGRSPVDLPDEASHPMLQQPGADGDRVVVSSDVGLWSIPTTGGGPATRIRPSGPGTVAEVPAGADTSIRPVVVAGCVHGAWRLGTGLYVARVCPDRPADDADDNVAYSGGAVLQNNALVFRTNHARVVLNNVATGVSWLFDDDHRLQKVDNWDDVHDENQPKKNTNPEIQDPKPKVDCATDANVALSVADQRFGVRAGAPTILPVLADPAAITSASCTVVAITGAEATGGTVDVVGTGNALQFRPDTATTTATIRYQVTDGRTNRTADAVAQVTVHPDESAGNEKPSTGADDRATTAVAGQVVAYNVLDGAADPEGDALSLVDACVDPGGGTGCLATDISSRSTTDGTVQYQADGWVRYQAPAKIVGTRRIAYKIQDQWGAAAEGSVVVNIKADDDTVRAVAHADVVRVTAGNRRTFDPTLNDVSLRGRPLTVGTVALQNGTGDRRIAEAALTRDHDNLFTVDGDLPVGTYLYTYEVADGGLPSQGFVRVDVVAAAAGDPIAVRDDVVVRGQEPVQVDLLANDLDPSGGVLVVQAIENPGADDGASDQDTSATAAQVQLLPDLKTARVTAPVDFGVGDAPIVVSYSVAAGARRATGTLVIRPIQEGIVQAPFPQPDGPVTVAPGGVVAVPVLDNDISPQGGPLKVTAVSTPDAAKGHAFVGGNQIRFVAARGAAATGSVLLRYTVADADGNSAESTVRLTILPSNPTQQPVLDTLALEGRVTTGSSVDIKVPLLAADPRGGVVGIVGIVDQPTKAKSVEILADGFRYHAGDDKTASVGTDEFTFRMSNGGESFSESTVRVGVVPWVPSASGPAVTPIRVTVGAGQKRVVQALDAPYVTPQVDLVTTGRGAPTQPRAGTGKVAVGADGRSLVYEAPTSLGGQDRIDTSFGYTVTDESGRRRQNQVIVTVLAEAPAVAPVAADDFVEPARSGQKVTVDLLDNDSDPNTGDPGSLDLTVVAGSGAPEDLAIDGGVATFTMTPASVRFRYRLTGTSGLSAEAIVSAPVDIGVRCEPVTFDVRAKERVDVDVLSRCKSPPGTSPRLIEDDDDPLPPEIGTTSIVGGKLRFVAKDVSSRTYPVTFKVCVDDGTCGKTTVRAVALARIQGSNDPPTMSDAEIHVPAGESTRVSLRRYLADPNPGDLDQIRFTPTTQSLVDGHVAASVDAEGWVTLKADDEAFLNQQGRDTFTVSFDDRHAAGGNTGRVTVVVDRTRAPAVQANADSQTVVLSGDQTTWRIDVLANDRNPTTSGGEGELEISSVSALSEAPGRSKPGTVAATSDRRAVEYRADPSFGGRTTFTYVVRDPSDSNRTATASVVLDVVGRPGLAGTPGGIDGQSRTIALQWTAADPNGGPVTFYELDCEVVGGGACPASVPRRVDSTGVTAEGLNNGTSYRFRVRANNQAGPSRVGDGWSPWSRALKPDARPQVTTVSAGDFSQTSASGPNGPDGVGGQLTITWNATVDGSAISEYRISVTGQGTRNLRSGDAGFGDRRYVWTGLTNGAAYSVSVVAVNDLGASEALTVPGTPMSAPPAPTEVTARSGDTSNTVVLAWNWSAPGIDAPDLFRIEGPNAPNADLPLGAPYEITIQDVPNGQNVRYRVRAHNPRGGWGDWSAYSNDAQAFGVPDKPTGTISPSQDSQKVRVSATPAFDGGSPITRYIVKIGSVEQEVLAADMPVDLGSFPDGTSVTSGTIKACNLRGCSEAGTLTGSATPFGIPAKPSNIQGTYDPVTRTIVWTWDPVAAPAGVTSVRYTVSGGGLAGGDQTVNGTTITTPALDCTARSYTLTISAFAERDGITHRSDDATKVVNKADTCPKITVVLGATVAVGTGACPATALLGCREVGAAVVNFPATTVSITCSGLLSGTIGTDAVAIAADGTYPLPACVVPVGDTVTLSAATTPAAASPPTLVTT
jgi:hypothetical protein